MPRSTRSEVYASGLNSAGFLVWSMGDLTTSRDAKNKNGVRKFSGVPAWAAPRFGRESVYVPCKSQRTVGGRGVGCALSRAHAPRTAATVARTARSSVGSGAKVRVILLLRQVSPDLGVVPPGPNEEVGALTRK